MCYLTIVLPGMHVDDDDCTVLLLNAISISLHKMELVSGSQLVHSEYLQLLLTLAMSLGLHSLLVCPPTPPHLSQLPTPNQWQWLSYLTDTIGMAESLAKKSSPSRDCSLNLPASPITVDPSKANQQPTVSA